MQDQSPYTRFCRNQELRSLLSSLRNRSLEEAAHAARVAVYSVAIGDALGLSEAELLNLRYGSTLHDIGKLAWPQAFLRPGATDRLVIERHPLRGIELIASHGWLKKAQPTILHHHERWNGSGYPLGLAGEEIPLGARIVAVAEVFDCLTMTSGWRGTIPEGEALKEIEDKAGSWFDPIVVAAFLKVQPIIQPVGL